MKSKQPTIRDLAGTLGISPSTVSRALKDHPDISPETKKRVNDLAEKLNYQPNTIALSLRSQKTNTIGVIVPEIVHFFFSTVISGIEEVAYDTGYTVMFCQSNESYQREVLDTKSLLAHRVDGMLVSFSKETRNFDHFEEVRKNIPIVFFDRIIKEMEASNVVVTDYDGAREATRHLVEQGCTRIAHLAGPANLTISKLRCDGYLDVLKAYNLTLPDGYIQDCGTGRKEEGYECAKKLLALPKPPDAIFANNDMAAIGAMQAVKEAGLSIPGDVAIVGFSNWYFSELTEPKMTTVAQPGKEMGKAAARLLIEELHSEDENPPPREEVLPTKLIIRESTLKR